MPDAIKPWHDAPECPYCKAPVVTPARFSPHRSTNEPAAEMWCPSCGEMWTSDDLEVVAQAFFSRGAWAGRSYGLDEVAT
jgi:uncharacterized protein with PIN domain